jgi:D-xylose transport system substrate-binding protein
MKNLIKAVVAGALLTTAMCGVSMAAGKTIAVSWKTFQEERWKTDEAALKAPPRSKLPTSKA